jgi:hypothetical protein
VIGQENSRLAGEGAGHRHPLLLTTGELTRQMFRPMAHADALQRLGHKLLPLGSRHSPISQGQFHIFVNGQIADKIETLENEANLAIADAGAIGERKVGDFAALQGIAPARRSIKQTENL